jgi:amidase
MTFADYESHDALGLAELVKNRDVSSRELVDACIDRIETRDPKLHAIVAKLYGDARKAADDPPDGPFRGVPFLLKDLMTSYAGQPTRAGSHLYDGFVPKHDGEMLIRYKRSGAIVVAKTATPELGLVPVTEPDAFGPTHNPWKRGVTPGGSSGGSAAAVAAGIAPMANGGDGGGSIRIPASCCGLFGLKPSRGRTPYGPDASEAWFGFAIQHVISRSVRDSAAMLDATRAPEIGAASYAPSPGRPFLSEVGQKTGKLKIAFTTKPHVPGNVHADCVAAVRDVAKLLEELGHEVVEDSPALDASQISRDFVVHVAAGTALDIAIAEELTGRKAKRTDVQTDTWVVGMLGRSISAADFAIARHRLQKVTRSLIPFFDKYDLLLTPTLGRAPVKHGELKPKGMDATLQEVVARGNLTPLLKLPGLVDQMAEKVFDFIPFTPLANFTGQPSMSVPLFWNDEGLPIGTMFTARWNDEAMLFRLAAQLEEARPWKDRRPTL